MFCIYPRPARVRLQARTPSSFRTLQVSTAATDAIKATDLVAGGITFKIGNGEWKTVNVGDASTEATIAGLSAAINNADLGVTANVLTNADGTARLSLVSKTDGSAGQITIADSTNNPTSPTSISDSTTSDTNANLGFTVIQNGIDATLKVDGVMVTSASNTVSNAIPGVTFQLLSTGTSDSNSTPPSIQVVIDNDTSSIETAIAKLVTDYNATIKAINAQEGKDSSGNPEPLYGTGVAAQIQGGLLTSVSRSFGSNAINSLIALGIKATPTADGTITLDADKLTSALNSSFDQVVSLFQDMGSFGAAFMETLDGLGTNSATGGAVALALKENSSQESTLNDNIDRQEGVIAAQKIRLTTELNLANQILQAIPQQMDQVDEMYSAITGYNRN
jgi:flagellar hook-associated protein 2